MRRALLLCLGLLACNGGDRGGGPLSGSAGLSAGEGAGTTEASATSGPSSTASSTSDGDSTTAASADDDASTSGNAATSTSDGESGPGSSGESGGATTDDGGESSGGLADGILDVTIIAHNDCTFTVNPASITVPEGTDFTVNWISSGSSEVEFDIAKIDMFNQVPIILGMEPGTSYHDDIREWCGDLFTGTFDFRLTSCFEDHYIPVDCGG